jgi:hypothetical protein
VVLHRVDEDGGASEILKHGGHVGVQRITNLNREDAFTVLGAENEVDR